MTLSALPERLLDEYYNIEATSIERLGSGVGGETFAVSAPSGRYVLKLMRSGGADHPENEPYLCAHLRQQGVPVSEYVADVHGALVQQADGRMFHLQRFVDGGIPTGRAGRPSD